jgi:hypothetical protein
MWKRKALAITTLCVTVATSTTHASADDSTTAGAERSEGSGQRTAGKVLFITGVSVFAAGWIAGGIATVAVVTSTPNARTAAMGESWVPLAGPYIMLADSSGYTGTQIAATATGAAIQTLGFTTMIIGAVAWATAPSSSNPKKAFEEGHMMVVPWAGSRSAGIAIGGVF